MAYITYEQYTELYGTAISETDFSMYATLASDLIDTITEYRIEKAGGLTAFPPIIQTQVEKATGAQILYFVQNGLETVLTGQTGQGFTVGKVHVDGGMKGNLTAAQMLISPLAKVYLEQSGLMERRVPCFNPYHSSYYGIW